MYDVVVIGAGASGLTTAMYTARANLKTLVIEKGIYGGQMTTTAEIENYSGFGLISGMELSQHMYDQAINQGVEYRYGEVVSVHDLYDTVEDLIAERNKTFAINLSNGERIESKAVVIATGVKHRKLGIKGEEALAGRGVSYCALCDGAFFKDKHVAVVGGGDSALEEANYLTQFVDKVTIIHRRDKFKAQAILQDRVNKNDKIRMIMNAEVSQIIGMNKVESIFVKQENNGLEIMFDEDVDGIFVYVGLDPITEPFKANGILDDKGYVITNDRMETSIKGLFAVGDVRQKTVRQIATAVGDGAIAGVEVSKYLEELS